MIYAALKKISLYYTTATGIMVHVGGNLTVPGGNLRSSAGWMSDLPMCPSGLSCSQMSVASYAFSANHILSTTAVPGLIFQTEVTESRKCS